MISSTREAVPKITRDGDESVAQIEGIGGVDQGKAWYLTSDEAIAQIRTGVSKFVTTRGLHRAILVVESDIGRDYIKTAADPTLPKNLLRLPRCP